MKKIKIVGAGGIGSILLPLLARFLDAKKEKAIITVIDGDSYEEKNRSRQLFDAFGNKADVSVGMIEKVFTNIQFRSRPEYLTPTSALYLLDEGDIIFSCVDNHKTRKLISEFCENELDDFYLFSGGNEFTDGNIQLFFRINGDNLTLPLTNNYHPEIKNPADKRPDEIGCGEMTESAPQLIFMNNMVSALMLNAFYTQFYEEGGCQYSEVYSDIITNNCRSLTRK